MDVVVIITEEWNKKYKNVSLDNFIPLGQLCHLNSQYVQYMAVNISGLKVLRLIAGGKSQVKWNRGAGDIILC